MCDIRVYGWIKNIGNDDAADQETAVKEVFCQEIEANTINMIWNHNYIVGLTIKSSRQTILLNGMTTIQMDKRHHNQ